MLPDTFGAVEQFVIHSREDRFEGMFEAHYGNVLAYCRRRTEGVQAGDVALETFEVAWRRLDEVPDNPLPWLYGVARHLLANAWRGDHRRARLRTRLRLVPKPDQGDRVSDACLARAALDRLRPDDREILMLVAWEGLDAEAAAESLGVSVSAFAVRLHRARRRLEKELLS